ncbi:MAG: prolipoprotein diacylglyceryl transferase [Cyclobacteriaceae bacterium]
MSYFERLKAKWGITSNRQLIIILIVFAATGSSVLFLKKPIVAYFSEDGEQSLWFSITYWILILPIYNTILLFYGFVFGQFQFFWEYEKRSFNRIFRRRAQKKADDQPA